MSDSEEEERRRRKKHKKHSGSSSKSKGSKKSSRRKHSDSDDDDDSASGDEEKRKDRKSRSSRYRSRSPNRVHNDQEDEWAEKGGSTAAVAEPNLAVATAPADRGGMTSSKGKSKEDGDDDDDVGPMPLVEAADKYTTKECVHPSSNSSHPESDPD